VLLSSSSQSLAIGDREQTFYLYSPGLTGRSSSWRGDLSKTNSQSTLDRARRLRSWRGDRYHCVSSLLFTFLSPGNRSQY
jgi:hypothetical protein